MFFNYGLLLVCIFSIIWIQIYESFFQCFILRLESHGTVLNKHVKTFIIWFKKKKKNNQLVVSFMEKNTL